MTARRARINDRALASIPRASQSDRSSTIPDGRVKCCEHSDDTCVVTGKSVWF